MTPTQIGQDDYRSGRPRRENRYRDHPARGQWFSGWDNAQIADGQVASLPLPSPYVFAIPSILELTKHAIEAERRMVELRAITGMEEAEAIQWLTVLSGFQATSIRETHASVYETFKRGILLGGSPVAAAAEVVRVMQLR